MLYKNTTSYSLQTLKFYTSDKQTTFKGWILLLLAYLFFVATTCEEGIEPGPQPEDITKEKRERLGNLIHEAILAAPNDFPILDRSVKGDSVIQNYLQTIYNQATYRIRLDRSSIKDNRWDLDRPWQVTVIDDPNRFAFSAPGGYFYISSGFLSGLSKGYEIYYLMAFEAINISEDFLLKSLIREYNIATILSLVDQPASFSPLALAEIAEFIQKDLIYESSVVREIDELAAQLICETSIFNRFGIIPILDVINFREQWRDTRPSYSDRLEYINSLRIEDCGAVKSTGAYKKFVLENLE